AWVVDGYAHYHHVDCPTLAGLSAEPIPLEEAIEVGFVPCATCYGGVVTAPEPEPEPEVISVPEPDLEPEPALTAALAAAEPVAAAPAESDATVWVVDGYLNYHREGCSRIAGADAVSIPLTQAVEDGFQPCGYCEPARPADIAEE